VGESLVGFGHLVRVVLLADCVAFAVLGGNEFSSETFSHVGFVAVTSCIEEPAEGESLGAIRSNFHRDLVVCTTNATGLDFDTRLDVFKAHFELFERGFLAFNLLVEEVESGIDDLFSNRLLALLEHDTDEFGDESGMETRIREDGAMESLSSSRHRLLPFLTSWPERHLSS